MEKSMSTKSITAESIACRMLRQEKLDAWKMVADIGAKLRAAELEHARETRQLQDDAQVLWARFQEAQDQLTRAHDEGFELGVTVNELRDALGAAQQEVLALKARLYDLAQDGKK
jgi:predicted  nucleic acid-binding Zn-ribbon protein